MRSTPSSRLVVCNGGSRRSPSLGVTTTHTVMVVDDQAIFREPIAAALNLSGYRTISATNGKVAFSLVKAEKPDLVLLDVMMPEMDAWTFLQAVRADGGGDGLRVILLTSMADKDSILRARNFGVREYILKERFSLEELLKRVKRCLAQPAVLLPALSQAAAQEVTRITPGPLSSACAVSVSIPRLLTRDQVVKRVEEFAEAKTLPGVVLNVINLANSPRSTVEDLVAVLKRDPVLASRILHVANSPSHASRKGRVSTIEEAVRNLGLGIVSKLASSAGIFEAFGSKGSGGIDLLRCWQHCFAVADIMDKLVEKTDAMPAGLPHLVGLCRDLGEIAVRQQFAEEFATACDIAEKSGMPLEEVESEVFGIAHHELILLLSSKLGLPDTIAAPIREFLSRELLETQRPSTGLAKALSMANTYAHGLLLASSAKATVEPFSPADYSAGFGTSDPTEIDHEELRGEVVVNTNLLAKLSAVDEAALSQPLLTAKDVKICYTRHTSLSPFDPLGVALQFFAKTEIHDALPAKPEDVNGCDGIVIAFSPLVPGTTQMIQIQRLRAAIQNAAIPILCLSAPGPGTLPTCSGNTEFMKYPVPLTKLHQFISKLGAI